MVNSQRAILTSKRKSVEIFLPYLKHVVKLLATIEKIDFLSLDSN